MNEQKQDLLAFLRELQFVIERHSAGFYSIGGEVCFYVDGLPGEVLDVAHRGECPSLAEAIERLESEITPQRETPDEDGTSYL